MSGDLATGASYLARGARMLRHPSLRLFVIIPLLVNVVIFATAWGIGFSYLVTLMDWLIAKLPSWLSFVEWILWPLLAITSALITGYLFTAVALIVASPFNALLAEKAEELITGRPVDSLEGLAAALWSVPRGVVRELIKLLYYIPMALLVLVLSIVPGINAFAPFLWFLLGAWMMSLQFLDYPMDNHQLSFAEVKLAAQDRRLSSMGFGGLVALCAGVPIVNFFVVPAAVVGATLLWCEELAE
ncbi:MAG: sulfate transporter CysZ [Pseudomonadota bacterium]